MNANKAPAPSSRENPESISFRDRQVDRFTILKFFLWGSFFQVPIFAVVNFLSGSHTAALTVLLIVIPLALTPWFSRRFHSPTFGANWVLGWGFTLFTINACFTGGLTAPALLWSLSIPMLATLMCGVRWGIFWAVLVSLKMSFFFWYPKLGGSFPQEYSEKGFSVAFYAAISGIAFLSLFLALVTEYFRGRYLKNIEAKNRQLQEALEKIRTLKGLLPICAWCKKIRNDQGYWDQMETYFQSHAEVEFTQSLCPQCETR